MMDISAFTSFLKRTYPCPEVDPQWVQECVQALEAAGQPTSIDDIHHQFLHSDLSLSTLESRTLPPSKELHDLVVFSRPTLFQIIALSEIGHSAFQLQTTMEQRSEVLSGQSRIRRMDDEDEEEEGRVPPYPRGMLRLELSDGRRVVKAMEYRRMSDLVLGQTSLGCKLLLHNVRCLRDVLLLTPENCQVLESSVEHLQAEQVERFTGDLERRMGKAADGNGEAQPPAPPVRRQLPPPVRHNGNGAPIRSVKREQPQPQLQLPPAPPSHGTVAQPRLVRPQPERHVSVIASQRRAEAIKASTGGSTKREIEGEEEGPSPPAKKRTKPTDTQRAGPRTITVRNELQSAEVDGDEYDYIVDDSFLRHVEEAEARASTSTDHRQTASRRRERADEYEDEDDDDDIVPIDSLADIRAGGIGRGSGIKGKTSHYFEQPKPEQRQIKTTSAVYYDPDDDDDEDDDAYNFDADESFIRQIDEAEARASSRINTSTSGSGIGMHKGKGSQYGQRAPSSSGTSASTLVGSGGGGSQIGNTRARAQEREPLREIIEISD